MKRKILLSGGGTGGHIYPALAIAEELKSRFKDVEICFAGTREGLESQIVPKAGYSLEFIRSAGIERRFTLDNVKNFSLAAAGLWDSLQLLKRFQPDIIIGTGGYVCGPLLLVAGLKKMPILLQEQNAVLGVTNRIVQRFANRIALGSAAAINGISGDTSRVTVTGNPVRLDFMKINRVEARKNLGISEQEKLIVITGGSRGAKNLNISSLELHQWIEKNENIRLLHATGGSQWKGFSKMLETHSLEIKSRQRQVVPYLENMPEVLRAADLIISRAGALALAEIALCGLPSILIPYPYAAEDHQTANARDFEQAGAAIVIPDKDLNGSKLLDEVVGIFNNVDRLQKMSSGALSLAKPEAASCIADLAVDLIEGVK